MKTFTVRASELGTNGLAMLLTILSCALLAACLPADGCNVYELERKPSPGGGSEAVVYEGHCGLRMQPYINVEIADVGGEVAGHSDLFSLRDYLVPRATVVVEWADSTTLQISYHDGTVVAAASEFEGYKIVYYDLVHISEAPVSDPRPWRCGLRQEILASDTAGVLLRIAAELEDEEAAAFRRLQSVQCEDCDDLLGLHKRFFASSRSFIEMIEMNYPEDPRVLCTRGVVLFREAHDGWGDYDLTLLNQAAETLEKAKSLAYGDWLIRDIDEIQIIVEERLETLGALGQRE